MDKPLTVNYHRNSTSLSSVADELLVMIVDHLRHDRNTLAKLSSTSHKFARLARPALYESIEVGEHDKAEKCGDAILLLRTLIEFESRLHVLPFIKDANITVFANVKTEWQSDRMLSYINRPNVHGECICDLSAVFLAERIPIDRGDRDYILPTEMTKALRGRQFSVYIGMLYMLVLAPCARPACESF
ncbi:hypothetical protein CC80DRAFT_546429 [Byssothecium circinans]|uniref:F-box domain-containing protein n=1 Tax=Byssothecium circinans TaxID=147558 RepID=A0A6A5U2K8_9PLEO|nr:hypothetical protein CC80DRAFT_546429 [Byssothecium circinans]